MGLGATLPNHIPACRSEFNHHSTVFVNKYAVLQIKSNITHCSKAVVYWKIQNLHSFKQFTKYSRLKS